MKNSLKNSQYINDNIRRILKREIDPGFWRRAKIILENIGIKGKMRVLDVGCGRGFYEQALSAIYPKVKIAGIDANEKYLNVAKETVGGKNISFYQADCKPIKF